MAGLLLDMSDSFADLWNSTAPSKQAQPSQPPTLGSALPSSQPHRPQSDVFSMLAAASPASSRSVTPSRVPVQAALKSASTTRAPAGPTRTVHQGARGGGDAFSDLFSGSSSTSNSSTKLTIAERAALAEKHKYAQQRGKQIVSSGNKQTPGSAWHGLDVLESSTFGQSRSNSISPAPPHDDDWNDLLAPPAVASTGLTAETVSVQDDDDWGLNDFVSRPVVKEPSRPPSQSQSLWELDEFVSPPEPAAIRVSPAPENSRTSTPGSFDFGDREDGLLEYQSGDEEDILGDLAKPPQPRPSEAVSVGCFPCYVCPHMSGY